jgi:Flp pilus assembly protein TadG
MQNRRGGVAPMFALAIIPVFGLAGAAVDYSRANSARTGLQSAIDATALAMAKLAPTLTPAQLQTQTTAYFNAMFSHPEATNLVITPTYTTSGGSQLTIKVTGSVNTSFMSIMGIPTLNIGSTSTVKWGMSRLRVALALDNTGSMADSGKMAALQKATTDLLAQLKTAAATPGDVYVSIVPFAKDVNVGASNYGANWIDWSDWEDDNGHDASSQTCTTTTKGKSGKSSKKCTTTTTWVPDNHNTWNGCITDRDQNYDTLATLPNPSDVNLPSTSASTLFPAEQYDSCPVAMKPLSYDWTTMNTLVGQMTPAGNTNQAIGLSWAWQSLVGGGPFGTVPAMDPNYTYNQVIILLTDGLNTEDRWYTNQSQIDAREKITCDNINAANVTLYTIQVNTGGDPVSTLLKNCAGTAPSMGVARKYPDTGNNFVVTASSGIGTVFTQIGTQLSKLRIAK